MYSLCMKYFHELINPFVAPPLPKDKKIFSFFSSRFVGMKILWLTRRRKFFNTCDRLGFSVHCSTYKHTTKHVANYEPFQSRGLLKQHGRSIVFLRAESFTLRVSWSPVKSNDESFPFCSVWCDVISTRPLRSVCLGFWFNFAHTRRRRYFSDSNIGRAWHFGHDEILTRSNFHAIIIYRN